VAGPTGAAGAAAAASGFTICARMANFTTLRPSLASTIWVLSRSTLSKYWTRQSAQEEGDQLVVEAAPSIRISPAFESTRQPEALGVALRELVEHVHGPAARPVEAVDHVDLLLQAGLLQLERRHLVELRLELLDVVLHLRDAPLGGRDLFRHPRVPEADRAQREQEHQQQLHQLLADVRLATRLSDRK
jgi:hypothetical protein